ncbi:serine hydrolase domain-containing protein [Gemmatimonadota bacterium]
MKTRMVGSVWLVVAALAGVGLLGCGTQGVATGATDVTWPGVEWPVSTPEAEGVDPATIESLVADIEAGQYGLVDHFLLIRHGKVVADYHFEQDYLSIAAQYDTTNHQYNYDHPEWHPYYRDTNLHSLQSVTKSVTSAALGIAMDEGLIKGVDVPGISFFGAYEPDLSDPRKTSMTLEDMLTMRSGIDWNEMISYDDASNSCIQMEASDEWIRFVLDRPMREDPGTYFDYNSGASVLLGKIVGVATGQRIDRWAEERLFNPIGITEYYWKTTPDGEVDTEGGLYLSAHDLARIAYLFLREGVWEGEQIISKEWVEASTAPVVPDVRPDNGRQDTGYGYQWWVPQHEGGWTIVFSGRGYGEQYPLVVPEHDIVVVFNGWNIHGGNERSTYTALWERILPAVR